MDVTTPVTSICTHTRVRRTETFIFFSFMTVGHGFLSELFMNALFLNFRDKFTYVLLEIIFCLYNYLYSYIIMIIYILICTRHLTVCRFRSFYFMSHVNYLLLYYNTYYCIIIFYDIINYDLHIQIVHKACST